MKSNMKIIQIGQDGGIQKWLENLGHDVKIVDGLGADLEKVYTPDLVVFTGGSDVSPFLYNQTNTHSHSDARRDLTEIAWYHKFYSVPKLGICRGGQFLHVMNGGEMVQDISRHAISGEHDCKFWNRDAPYQVTSTHHQMMKMRPDTPAIAYANLNSIGYSRSIRPHLHHLVVSARYLVRRISVPELAVVLTGDSVTRDILHHLPTVHNV